MLIPAAQLYLIPSPFKHSNPWTTPENKVLTIKRSDFLTRPNSRGPCRVFRNMLYIQHRRSLYIPTLRHKPKGVVSPSRPRIIADDQPVGITAIVRREPIEIPGYSPMRSFFDLRASLKPKFCTMHNAPVLWAIGSNFCG